MNSNFSLISEDQYIRLCKKCNEILNSKNSTILRVAIPWLHPIREHPIFLERYKYILLKKGFFNKIYLAFIRRIKNRLIWIRQMYRSIIGYNKYWYTKEVIQSDIDCLFISHILNSSQLSNIDDFYFANIPSELVKRNYSILVGYINSLDLSDKSIYKSIKPSAFSRVYFTNTLSFLKELSIRKLLNKESQELKLNSNLNNDNFTKEIYNYASSVIFNGESQAMLRLYEQIKKLVRESNPKALICLYEGHAYERICMAAARTVNPNIVCISYQHTGTFRLSNAIKSQFDPQYNPNVIFTSGSECKEELRKINTFDKTHIEVLGSIRGIDNSIKISFNKSNQYSCLVIPEGIISECLFLFIFSLECAKLNPDIYFIWRLHPSVTFEVLKSKEKNFKNLPSNIILSDQPLDKDVERSNWVLYRGTTAIFKAISCGLRPFYLREIGELTIDPLFIFNEWRIIIDSPYKFLEVIENDINNNFNDFYVYQKLAVQACKDRFSNIDIGVFDKILKIYL